MSSTDGLLLKERCDLQCCSNWCDGKCSFTVNDCSLFWRSSRGLLVLAASKLIHCTAISSCNDQQCTAFYTACSLCNEGKRSARLKLKQKKLRRNSNQTLLISLPVCMPHTKSFSLSTACTTLTETEWCLLLRMSEPILWTADAAALPFLLKNMASRWALLQSWMATGWCASHKTHTHSPKSLVGGES